MTKSFGVRGQVGGEPAANQDQIAARRGEPGSRLSRIGIALALAGGVGCGPGAFGAEIPNYDASSDGSGSTTTPDAGQGVDGTVKHDAGKDAGHLDASSTVPDGATSLLCGTDASPASEGPSCCTMGAAYCLPSYDVEQSQVANFATCSLASGSGGVCVPAKIITAGSSFAPKSCASLGGSSGVCLSKCLGAVQTNPATPLLMQGTCDSDELCAPCINPLNGMNTGACDIHPVSCTSDAGSSFDASEPDASGIACPYTGPAIINPAMYPECSPACGGAHCVPGALVPAAQQPLLATCATEGGVGYCAPDTVIQSAGQGLPPTCTSIAGAEGRCLSTCIPQVSAQAEALPQDVCAAGTLCTPCYNPTAADPTAPTGACNIACDKPAKPPVILSCPYTGADVVNPAAFPDCSPACAGAHCVPSGLVPTAQQAQLTACGTGATAGFCTPDAIVAAGDNYVPPSCQPFTDPASEGRCTSTCLPSVEAQASELSQTTCGANTLCAPCYDPFSGVSTGACNLACDKPKDAPFKFPLCCAYEGAMQGTCLPSSLVPSAQQSSLEAGSCPTDSANPADYLCVPNEYLPNAPAGAVKTCTTTLNEKGTCVSDCANQSIGALSPQGTCPDNHRCISCALAGSTTPGCE